MSPYEDIVIGLSLPKTGRYASKAGVVYERAYNLWLKERWGSSDSAPTVLLPGRSNYAKWQSGRLEIVYPDLGKTAAPMIRLNF